MSHPGLTTLFGAVQSSADPVFVARTAYAMRHVGSPSWPGIAEEIAFLEPLIDHPGRPDDATLRRWASPKYSG